MSTAGDMRTVPVTIERTAHATISLRDPRLHPDEPLAAGISRIAVGQIDRAVRALTKSSSDFDDALHRARRSIKRLRAVLRLVRDEIGAEMYRDENQTLRDAARRLGGARDSFVLIVTLERVIDDYQDLLAAGAFEDTDQYLRARHRAAIDDLVSDRQTLGHVVATLEAARTRFESWATAVRPDARAFIRDEFAAVAPGLEGVYRRSRRDLDRVISKGTDGTFHEWRRNAKYLRYQLETLEPIWPDVVGGHAARLNELGELLGIDHDLFVLADCVREDPAACPNPRARRLLVALVDEARADLQEEALVLGSSLYAEKPRAFVDRMGGYWRTARGA
jgi:CHAD domain-containing protein